MSGSGCDKAAAYEKAGVEMSIFDRFISRDSNEQEKKAPRPTSCKKVFSELDATSKEAKAQYPDDSKSMDDFLGILKEVSRVRYKKVLEGGREPMKAEAQFFLSEDRMSAYACLLPPENNGDGLTLEEFLEDIRYEGICYGILQEELQREFEQGYLRIFLVAQGSLPQAGQDGSVTELFQRHGNLCLEVQDGDPVNLGKDIQLQPIRKGTVICQIQLPKAGTDGMDVTGQILPASQSVGADIPQGKNTIISKDGQALAAGVDGILYIENDRFCVHEQKIIDGNLDQFQGVLRISGNLYIGGNVDGGVEVEVSGDVVVAGKVGQARITSREGTILVQQGIYGRKGGTLVSANRQVQSPVVEWAEISAGTSVFAETISNSVIRCGDTVYATNGRGMIADSHIQAGGSVLCQRIGNLAGGHNRFSVGYPPHVLESWERSKAELAQVQSTLELLWNSITDLRKKGTRISPGEKAVLDKLVEQRELYTQRRETLTAELHTMNQILGQKSAGRIQCEKLYPSLDVHIGRAAEEITTAEENCDIRVVDNVMLLR